MFKTVMAGSLFKDSETKEINGKTLLTFTLSHQEKWTDKQGQKQERVTWVDCKWWLTNDKMAQFLKTGAVVYVEGEISARAYENKNKELVGALQLNIRELNILKFSDKGSEIRSTLPQNSGGTNAGSFPTSQTASNDVPF